MGGYYEIGKTEFAPGFQPSKIPLVLQLSLDTGVCFPSCAPRTRLSALPCYISLAQSAARAVRGRGLTRPAEH